MERQFYEFHQEWYVIFFCKKYPTVLKEDIEDCVANATLDLIEEGIIFEREGKLVSSCQTVYIITAINWKVLRFLRKGKGNITIDQLCLSEIDMQRWKEQNLMEEDDEDIKKRKTLQKALASLRADEREILYLAIVQKMPYKKIGKLFGITHTYVAVKVNRILKKLRNFFND